jgi:hypothetical protein
MFRIGILLTAVASILPTNLLGADEASELKEKILAAWKAREQKVTRFKVVMDAEHTESAALHRRRLNRPDDETIGEAKRKVRSISLASDGVKYAYQYYILNSDSPCRFVTNGEVATDYYPNRDTSGASHTALVWDHARFGLHRAPFASPILLLYRPATFLTMGESPPEITVFPSPVSIDSFECCEMELNHGSLIDRLFLDVHNAFIVRHTVHEHTIYVGDPDAPPRVAKSAEMRLNYKGEAGGLPRLESWTITSYDPSGNGSTYNSCIASVVSVALDTALREEEFDPYAFPEGTIVAGIVSGKAVDLWIQGKDGQRLPVEPYTPPRDVDQFKEQLKPNRTASIWIFVVSGCILMLALILLWRRASQGKA